MTKLTYPVPGIDSYRKDNPQEQKRAVTPQRQTYIRQPGENRPMPRAPLRSNQPDRTPVRTSSSTPAPAPTTAPVASPAPSTAPRAIPSAAPVTASVPRPFVAAIPTNNGPTVLGLEQFLQRYSDLPEQTAALGYCDDKLPVLFDFTQASAGPLLILGDHGSGKTNLLRVLLSSAAHANAPHQFKYMIIAAHPDEYGTLAEEDIKARHCIDLLGTYDQQAHKAIVRMATLAEERYNHHRVDPPALVVIDDMKFITTADTDVRLNFEWLVKHGPAVHVWPVVALQTESALDMGRWTAHFRTRVIGRMPEKAANRLGMYTGLNANDLHNGKQFGVHVDQTWMRFWVPFAKTS